MLGPLLNDLHKNNGLKFDLPQSRPLEMSWPEEGVWPLRTVYTRDWTCAQTCLRHCTRKRKMHPLFQALIFTSMLHAVPVKLCQETIWTIQTTLAAGTTVKSSPSTGECMQLGQPSQETLSQLELSLLVDGVLNRQHGCSKFSFDPKRLYWRGWGSTRSVPGRACWR